jgi:hypothetical protein
LFLLRACASAAVLTKKAPTSEAMKMICFITPRFRLYTIDRLLQQQFNSCLLKKHKKAPVETGAVTQYEYITKENP